VTRYIALVRGVNVGGHNKLPMAEFRKLLSGLNHTDVTTYLQSGNAVFTSTKRSPAKLSAEIQAALGDRLSLDVRTLVLSIDRLRQIIDNNPMARDDEDPTHLYVAFLSGKPDAAAIRQVDPAKFAPDRFEVIGDVIYLHYPKGMGKSKLDPGSVFAKTGIWATARNWRTVNQLAALASQS